MNLFSDIFCFDWYQIRKNFIVRITENMEQNCTASFNAKWAAVPCVTSVFMEKIKKTCYLNYLRKRVVDIYDKKTV